MKSMQANSKYDDGEKVEKGKSQVAFDWITKRMEIAFQGKKEAIKFETWK